MAILRDRNIYPKRLRPAQHPIKQRRVPLSPDGRVLLMLVSFYILLTTVPQLVKRIIVGRSFDAQALAGEVDNPTQVTILGFIFAAMLAVGCCLVTARNLPRFRSGVSTLLFTLLTILFVPLLFGNLDGFAWGSIAVNMLFVLALATLRPELTDLRIFSHLGTVIAGGSILYGILSEAAWRAGTIGVDDTKAIIGTGILAGPYPSSNNLGMGVAMALSFAMLVPDKKTRYGSVTIMLAALILSASRTSLIALAVGAFVATILSFFRERLDRKIIYFLAVFFAAVVSATLPWVVYSTDAFTSRGGIWMASREAILSRPFEGWGFDAYSRNGIVAHLLGAIAPAGHNVLLHYWVVSGLAGMFAMSWLLWRAVTGGAILLSSSIAPAVFVVVLLVLTMAEMPLRPEAAIGQCWISLPVVVLLTSNTLRSQSMGYI